MIDQQCKEGRFRPAHLLVAACACRKGGGEGGHKYSKPSANYGVTTDTALHERWWIDWLIVLWSYNKNSTPGRLPRLVCTFFRNLYNLQRTVQMHGIRLSEKREATVCQLEDQQRGEMKLSHGKQLHSGGGG